MEHIKRTLLMLCLIFPIVASAMKIEKDEIDEFSGKRTLITSWESLCGKTIHIRFRLQNGNQLLDFKFMEDGALVIGEGDKLMFKSTTDNIGEFSPISIYHGTTGGGAINLVGSSAWGISASYSGDLSYFSDNTIRLLRLNTTSKYYDRKIGESEGKKLQKLFSLFSSAMGGEVGKGATFANYTISYFKSKNGGRSWETVDEKYIKDASPDEIQSIMEEWKSQSSGNKLFDCKAKKEK